MQTYGNAGAASPNQAYTGGLIGSPKPKLKKVVKPQPGKKSAKKR